MKKHTIFVIVCIVLSLSIFLVACGKKEDVAKETAEGAKTTETPQDDQSEKWIYVNAALPLNYDPGIGGLASVDCSVYFNVYDSLLFTDIDGTVIPHVATEWSHSEDGLTYTFKIRDDIKFHNGDQLEAEDVAFSMNRSLEIGRGFSYLWAAYVDRAEATDANTVVFHLKKPYGVFEATLTRLSILNKDQVLANKKADGPYGENGDYGMDWLLTNDAGSGPYMTKDVNINEYIICSKFDDYWMPWDASAPDGFSILGVNETAVVRTMISNKELSITDEWQSQESIRVMSEFDGVEISNIYSGAIHTFEMNTKKAPTDDVHFRKCLAHLFNYDYVIQEIYPGTKRTFGPVSAAYEGHDESVYQYTFDIEKAKEELQLSKYADNPGEHTVEIHYCSAVPDMEKLALVLQENAVQLGINVTITSTPFGTMLQNASSVDTTPSMSMWSPSDSYSEAGAVLNLRYHSSSAGTSNQFEWLQNDSIDQAIEEALGELDKEKRLGIYKQIQHDIVDLCPSIWCLEWPEQRAYRADLFTWPEAEAEVNAPILGRSLYFRTIKFK